VSTSSSSALVEEFRAWLRAHAAELAAFTRRVPVEIEKQVEHERVLQRMLWDAGWLRRGWPESSGGSGGSALDRGTLYDALWQAGYLVPESMAAVEVIGPAVVTYAPDLARTLLPAYLRGDEIWCQGFSEPGSGSDLASLRTRIEDRGGSLRITGQKIWASTAGEILLQVRLIACVVSVVVGAIGDRAAVVVRDHRHYVVVHADADQRIIDEEARW